MYNNNNGIDNVRKVSNLIDNNLIDKANFFAHKMSSSSTYEILSRMFGVHWGIPDEKYKLNFYEYLDFHTSEIGNDTNNVTFDCMYHRYRGKHPVHFRYYKDVELLPQSEDTIKDYTNRNSSSEDIIDKSFYIRNDIGQYVPKYNEFKVNDNIIPKNNNDVMARRPVSMLDNFLVNHNTAYDEYKYKVYIPKRDSNNGVVKIHSMFFPVYYDDTTHTSEHMKDYPLEISNVDIEVSFENSPYSNIKYFEYVRPDIEGSYANTSDSNYVQGTFLHNKVIEDSDNKDYIGKKCFRFVPISYGKDANGDVVNIKKASMAINPAQTFGEYTEFSRLKLTRGNHIYKYKLNFSNKDYINNTKDLDMGELSPQIYNQYSSIPDMVYGMTRAMMVPNKGNTNPNQDNIRHPYFMDKNVADSGYFMSVFPNYDTVYVDFVSPSKKLPRDTRIPEVYNDLRLAGFFRVRYCDINPSAFENGKGTGCRDYEVDDSYYHDTTTYYWYDTNKHISIKFSIPRHYNIASSNYGECHHQLYMLPPLLFGDTLSTHNTTYGGLTPILLSTTDNSNLYITRNYHDTSYNNLNDNKFDISNMMGVIDNGGWLFPPLRFAKHNSKYLKYIKHYNQNDILDNDTLESHNGTTTYRNSKWSQPSMRRLSQLNMYRGY